MRSIQTGRIASVLGGIIALAFIAAMITPSQALAAGTAPEAYGNVAEMQSAHPFYIAHRGGSSDWPEMSMAAYNNAAAWGAGALEVSVARTKDGRFFGLHDATLDRTSQVSGSIDPRTLTWAELTASYRNTLNAATVAGEPYAELSEVFAAHARSRVIFVDTKYIGDLEHRQELITLMLSYAPAEHWVLKGYYDDLELATLAADAGITSWGYYYARDLDELATTQERWSMLGLEVDASSEQWSLINTAGKPTIAFMIANQHDLADALSKGADGMMTTSLPNVFGSPRLESVPDPEPAIVPTPISNAAPRPLAKKCKVFKPVVQRKRYKVRRCITGQWTPEKTRTQRAKALKIAKAKHRSRTGVHR